MNTRTPSAAIQRNADKVLALVEAERNGAITALTPQVIDIQKRFIQFHDRLANATNIHPDAVKELANLQDRFTQFQNSSGIMSANAARIDELQAVIAQLQIDNSGLLASNATAIRDATVAREEEELAKKTLDQLRQQLGLIGMGQKDDGRLAFNPEWKILLEEVGKLGSRGPGQLDISSGIVTLAAKLRSERGAGISMSSSSPSNNNQPEAIDLTGDSPDEAQPSK